MFTVEESLKATQAYLRSGKTLADFEAEHGIRGKSDGQHVILDYDQLAVKWTEPYGYACRGLVLDAVTFDVIALGLGKFFNFGEHYAAQLDWSSAITFEKVDGSMVNRWWSPHSQRFECSTRFQLPSDIKVNTVNTGVITWETLIRQCMAAAPVGFWDAQPKHETWTLEVCCPHNMVVVRHNSFFSKLLAVRDIQTLQEKDVRTYALRPTYYSFASGTEVAEFANKYPATELEGFVTVDKSFNRVKIKSDQYVQLHRAKDGLQGINNLLLLARTKDYEEIVVHFPEYRDDLETADGLIESAIQEHERVYEELKDIPVQKDFALQVQGRKLLYPAALFSTRAGKSKSVRDAFGAMNDTSFCKMFKEQLKKLIGDKYEDGPSGDAVSH